MGVNTQAINYRGEVSKKESNNTHNKGPSSYSSHLKLAAFGFIGMAVTLFYM